MPSCFDDCNNAYVWGGCTAAQKVKYLNGARSCRALLAAESATPVDIVQEWRGTGVWQGYVRPDGTVISISGEPPTDGFWEKRDIVWNKEVKPEEPHGWRYDGGTWVALSRRPVVKYGDNAGTELNHWDVLIIDYSLHTINFGYPGQQVIVVNEAEPSVRLSDSGGGNIPENRSSGFVTSSGISGS